MVILKSSVEMELRNKCDHSVTRAAVRPCQSQKLWQIAVERGIAAKIPPYLPFAKGESAPPFLEIDR
jgi:hypothetical protein